MCNLNYLHFEITSNLHSEYNIITLLLSTNKYELEVLQFLEDAKKVVAVLNSYPNRPLVTVLMILLSC